jgi:4-amino-4-deoxy-L-arabinose transferase-like glycosyltransferase
MRARFSTALLLILALALVARVVVIVATPDFAPIFDAADFDRHAVSIAAGDGYAGSQLKVEGPTAFRPPLYPLALAGVRALGGGWTTERLLGTLLGVATVLLVYVLSRRLWGERVGMVAGLLAAVFPPLVVFSASLLSEVLFIPLMLAALLAVLEYRDDGRLRWAVVAGVLCGVAGLTRTNGLLLVLPALAGVWTLRPRLSRAALAAPAAVVLASIVAFAPWTVRNTIEFDRFVGTGTATGFALAGTYNDDARARAEHPGEPTSPQLLATYRDIFTQPNLDEAELTGKLNDRAVSYMREHPGYVVETMAWNVLRVFELLHEDSFKRVFLSQTVQGLGLERLASPLFLVSLYAVFLLGLLGIAAQVGWLPSRRAPTVIWGMPIVLILPALAIYGLARYRAPVDPFLVMLAAVGMVAAAERLGSGSRAIGASTPK